MNAYTQIRQYIPTGEAALENWKKNLDVQKEGIREMVCLKYPEYLS